PTTGTPTSSSSGYDVDAHGRGDRISMVQQVVKSREIRAGSDGERSRTGSEPNHADRELALELRGITKQFESRSGTVVALKDVSLTVRRREFVALVGRSGCGKTTMLRIFARL